LGSQRREKLDPRYPDNARIFAPLYQRGQDFVENHHARHNWRAGKMSRQAGVISWNHLSCFKIHLADVSPIKHVQQIQRARYGDPLYRWNSCTYSVELIFVAANATVSKSFALFGNWESRNRTLNPSSDAEKPNRSQ